MCKSGRINAIGVRKISSASMYRPNRVGLNGHPCLTPMRHPKFSDRVFGVYTGVFLANGVYTGYIRLTAPRSQLYGPFENGEMCKLYARVRLYAVLFRSTILLTNEKGYDYVNQIVHRGFAEIHYPVSYRADSWVQGWI